MKNIFVALTIILWTSCVPLGNKKEDAEELIAEKIGKIELNKATIENYWFEINGEEIKSAKIPYGSSVKLRMRGLKGFTKNDKNNMDCLVAIKMLDENNKEVFGGSDLMGEKYPDGIPETEFTDKLHIKLKFQTPCQLNKKYKVIATIKDRKTDAKAEITAQFEMVLSLGLTYEENGMISDGPFVCNSSANVSVSKNVLGKYDTLGIFFTGLKGISVVNDMVWPDASMRLLTESGEVILDQKDLFKEYEQTGVAKELVMQSLYLHLNFEGKLKSGRKYTAVFWIGDKKDKSKSLSAKYEFTIK